MFWTLGLSYDNYDLRSSPQFNTAVSDVFPKLGLQWRINDFFGVRLAAFRNIKPPLAASATIQPSQVGGFNQFFDDATGTESWRYAAALDAHLAYNLSRGVEASIRNLSVPLFSGGRSRSNRHTFDEYLYRSYLYWTPSEKWAISAALSYDIFDTKQWALTFPTRVETFSTPLAVRYFDPSGLFAGLSCTPVYQQVRRPEGSEGNDTFAVVDAEIGYRLPGRLGIISAEIDNVFGAKMNYQDDNFREFTQMERFGPFLPDRMVAIRVSLNF